MKRCAAKPYEGQEKYIFVSYCHKDRAYVFPIIEQLTKDGYRVWYDEGLSYSSDAPAELADKIAGCDVVVAFLSDNTVDSYAFKREINFAILKKKEMIAVMLEDVHLSPGLEMQLAAFPAIFKYKLENSAFYKRLYAFEAMSRCLGDPNDSIEVSDENEYAETLADLYGADERKKPVIPYAALAES